MNRQYFKWYSPSLGRDMELLTYGHSGQNFVVFPTSKGRFFDWEGFGAMIPALQHHLEQGHLQITCVDSVDAESWYNYGAPPSWRAQRHNQYDSYVYNEVLPFIVHRTGNPYIVASGCSFGGYHACNFGFRHPDRVRKIVSMSGSFDIRDNVVGYYDDNVYYNNPIDYMPGLWDENILRHLRNTQVYLGVAPNEPFTGDHRYMADLLRQKGVPVRLDIPPDATHDWPFWRWYVTQCL